MFQDSSDQDEGKASAMRDPGYRALRNNNYRREGYEEDKCWKRCKKSLFCQIITKKRLWIIILISAIIIMINSWLDSLHFEIPYCSSKLAKQLSSDLPKAGCSYNSVWLWDCRPCPNNAVCDGGKMVSASNRLSS